MKHILFSLLAVFALATQSSAQSFHEIVNGSDADGSALFEYHLNDTTKILHFKINAQSNHPFVSNQAAQENQVIIFIDGAAQFVVEFTEYDFPYGSSAIYTGTIDLSAYSLLEISQMTIWGAFDFAIAESEGVRYKSLSTNGETFIDIN